jgi:hypothetical protein
MVVKKVADMVAYDPERLTDVLLDPCENCQNLLQAWGVKPCRRRHPRLHHRCLVLSKERSIRRESAHHSTIPT